MPTVEHKRISSAAFNMAVTALQCDALVRAITARDHNTTGFHRLASAKMAERAWKCFVDITRNEGGDPEDNVITLMHGADSAESSANLLLAYTRTLTATKEFLS